MPLMMKMITPAMLGVYLGLTVRLWYKTLGVFAQTNHVALQPTSTFPHIHVPTILSAYLRGFLENQPDYRAHTL